MARTEETPGGETLLTRYRIFKTEDGGLTLEYLGHQDAKNSDAALREFFPADTIGHHAAVSENHFKIRNLVERAGPVIATEPLPWPEVTKPPEPVAEPEQTHL